MSCHSVCYQSVKCFFLFNLHFCEAPVSCVCVWVDSWLLQDRKSHLYFTMSTQLCPSVYEKKKKKGPTVAHGPREYDYNMTHEVAVSRLNLKWKAFYIGFLRKIPFHSYTNKSVPCSTMLAVCIYLLRWLMTSLPLLSSSFFQDFVQVRTRWMEISWYAIDLNVTCECQR